MTKLAGPVELIRLHLKRYALRLQCALQVADVGERGEFLRVGVPAGIESQDVPLEHPLKESDL